MSYNYLDIGRLTLNQIIICHLKSECQRWDTMCCYSIYGDDGPIYSSSESYFYKEKFYDVLKKYKQHTLEPTLLDKYPDEYISKMTNIIDNTSFTFNEITDMLKISCAQDEMTCRDLLELIEFIKLKIENEDEGALPNISIDKEFVHQKCCYWNTRGRSGICETCKKNFEKISRHLDDPDGLKKLAFNWFEC